MRPLSSVIEPNTFQQIDDQWSHATVPIVDRSLPPSYLNILRNPVRSIIRDLRLVGAGGGGLLGVRVPGRISRSFTFSLLHAAELQPAAQHLGFCLPSPDILTFGIPL